MNNIKRKREEETHDEIMSKMDVDQYNFNWKIENFSHMASQTKSFFSPHFTGGIKVGNVWEIELIPNDGDNNMGLYLQLIKIGNKLTEGFPIPETIKCECVISLVDINGVLIMSKTSSEEFKTMDSFGTAKFISLSYLQTQITIDTFTIRISVTTEMGMTHHSKPKLTDFFEEEMKSLEKKLKLDLIEHKIPSLCGQFTDVKILNNGIVFESCSVIMASHSDVFKIILESRTPDQCKEAVVVPDAFKPYVVDCMIQYLNSSKVPSALTKCTEEILEIAHHYQIKGLKDICELALMHKITMDNVQIMLLMIDKFSLEKLEKKLFQFIQENNVAVLNADFYKSAKESPKAFKRVLEMIEENCMECAESE